MSPTPIQAAIAALVSALDDLAIPYFIGGSVASSTHGNPRSTLDADIVARLSLEHVDPLVGLLGDRFYADREMIRDAVERRAPFNVIHLSTMMKVDVFVLQASAYDQAAFGRARDLPLDARDARLYRLSSPEDVVLHKLLWYRSGHGVSERQWRDVIGVLRVQGEALDRQYMETWAGHLGIADLLRRAFDESGPGAAAP